MRSLLCLLLAAAPALAWTTPVISTDEVRPGMTGTGRTVFSTARGVEEFQVEVIDVMRQATPRGDLVLCRLSGARIEHYGIIAGMSGSPVYLDGKLLGAVAYAWGFAKDPICGVTPATEMLDIWNLPQGKSTGGARGSPRSALSRLGLTPAPAPPERALPRSGGMTPIMLPVAVSNLTPGLSRIITPDLNELGLMPVAAAGAAAAPDTSALVPGAAVGVALTDGDVRIAGIGTLTAREGDRLVAFGHPMLQAGSVRLPMCGGVIHGVLPSLASSFKLFSPTAPVGVVDQDRLPGISGTIGPVPEMIPVTVTLRSAAAQDTYRFRVAEVDELAPVLIAAGVAECVYQTEGTQEQATLTSTMRVAPAGMAPVEVRHAVAGPDPAAPLFGHIRDELTAIFDNPFSPPGVARIDFDLQLRPGCSAAWFSDAVPDRRVVRPGESLSVSIRLRDYRGAIEEASFGMRIPPTTPEGKLRLLLGSSDSLLGAQVSRAPAAYEPRSLAELARLMGRLGREDEVVALAVTEASGLVVGNSELPAPPASLRSVAAPQATGPTESSLILEKRFPMKRPVYGSARLELEVKR